MADAGGQDNFGDPWDLVDKVTGSARQEWWDRQDSEQKIAWSVLAGTAAVGVVWVQLVSLATADSIPTMKHLVAGGFLIVVTLHISAAAAVFALLVGKTAFPALLAVAALMASFGVGLVNDATDAAESIADFYCFNDGTVLEKQCREFKERGFYASTQGGSTEQNVDLLANRPLRHRRGGTGATDEVWASRPTGP